MDSVPIGRRLKAARQLADITVDELASRLDIPGLGSKTIGNIERGERDIRPHEVEPIARALEVPATFLVGDNPAGESQLEHLEARITEVLGAVEKLVEQQNGLLARQSAILERIEYAIVREDEAARRDDESARLLDDAVRRASRALQAGSQGPVAGESERERKGTRRTSKRAPA